MGVGSLQMVPLAAEMVVDRDVWTANALFDASDVKGG